jgi:hypothetical protein
MNRRSFFQRCAGFVATIALAPELAFGQPVKRMMVSGWDLGSGNSITVCHAVIPSPEELDKIFKDDGKWKEQDEFFKQLEIPNCGAYPGPTFQMFFNNIKL